MEIESEKNKLIQFIRNEIGEFKLQIDENTKIEDDLGVTGDEAVELIIKISKIYNIDLSDFDFKKYFHPEPSMFIKYSQVKEFTIKNILESIISGKLT